MHSRCSTHQCEQGEFSIIVPDWVAHKQLLSHDDLRLLYAPFDTAPRRVILTHLALGQAIVFELHLYLFGVEIHRVSEKQGQNVVSRWFSSGINGECHEVLDVSAEPYWRRIVWLYSLGESTCYKSMAKNSLYDSFFEYAKLTLGYSISPLYRLEDLEDRSPSGEYWGETTYSLGSDADINLAPYWYSQQEIRIRMLMTVLPKEPYKP